MGPLNVILYSPEASFKKDLKFSGAQSGTSLYSTAVDKAIFVSTDRKYSGNYIRDGTRTV